MWYHRWPKSWGKSLDISKFTPSSNFLTSVITLHNICCVRIVLEIKEGLHICGGLFQVLCFWFYENVVTNGWVLHIFLCNVGWAFWYLFMLCCGLPKYHLSFKHLFGSLSMWSNLKKFRIHILNNNLNISFLKKKNIYVFHFLFHVLHLMVCSKSNL